MDHGIRCFSVTVSHQKNTDDMMETSMNATKKDISIGKLRTDSNFSRTFLTGITTGSEMVYATKPMTESSPPGNQLTTALTSIAIWRRVTIPSATPLISSINSSKPERPPTPVYKKVFLFYDTSKGGEQNPSPLR